MIQFLWLLLYSSMGCILFYIDRLTKMWALHNAIDGVVVNKLLSFDLVFNRGVTAGMLQSDNATLSALLSLMIGAICAGLFLYMCYRWYYGHAIIGEMLTFSGAISNLCDRYFFGAVIDFIHVKYMGYSFPIFNIADICIVLGVVIMFFVAWKEDAL